MDGSAYFPRCVISFVKLLDFCQTPMCFCIVLIFIPFIMRKLNIITFKGCFQNLVLCLVFYWVFVLFPLFLGTVCLLGILSFF